MAESSSMQAAWLHDMMLDTDRMSEDEDAGRAVHAPAAGGG